MTQPNGYICLSKSHKALAIPKSIAKFSQLGMVLSYVLRIRVCTSCIRMYGVGLANLCQPNQECPVSFDRSFLFGDRFCRLRDRWRETSCRSVPIHRLHSVGAIHGMYKEIMELELGSLACAPQRWAQAEKIVCGSLRVMGVARLYW
jgi:hypothetical protein